MVVVESFQVFLELKWGVKLGKEWRQVMHVGKSFQKSTDLIQGN